MSDQTSTRSASAARGAPAGSTGRGPGSGEPDPSSSTTSPHANGSGPGLGRAERSPALPPPTAAELSAHASLAAARRSALSASPGTEERRDWDAITPRGLYPQFGQSLMNTLLLLTALPAALVLGFPVALVNLFVFRDPRRIFFVQERIGHRGRPFRIVKFRTMRETQRDEFASWSGTEDRLRVTTFGRLLRNTHLDELPQLVNVARGEMSFIGPRPEMREIEEWAASEVPGFTSRLAVKPGITGWAQITQGYTGRCPEAYARKLEANLYYLDRLSLSMDVGILLRTAVWMLRGKGWSWNSGQSQAPGRDAGSRP